VLADYSSDQLDLSDPGVYRDLARPVGVLQESKEKALAVRYAHTHTHTHSHTHTRSPSLSEPRPSSLPGPPSRLLPSYAELDGDPMIPPFHYGNHYSYAEMVKHYLIRLEPFTSLAMDVQGGKLDHADRLFASIPGTWANLNSPQTQAGAPCCPIITHTLA
jgi:hypothetical protein